MFSLRRLPVQFYKTNHLIPQHVTQKAAIVSRAISSITSSSRNTSSFSMPIAIQRRGFSNDNYSNDNYNDSAESNSNYTYRPRILGMGNTPSPSEHRAPDGKPLKPTPVLYIGNIQFDVSEDALREHFETVAPVRGVRIIHDVRGMSKGFGYVDFGDASIASRVADTMHNSLFAGRRLNVQFLANPQQANPNQPNPPSKTLFIGNMNYDMTDEDINELFKDISNCLDIRVAMDRRTGKPRGFAHADFASVDAAVLAKEKLEGRLFFGRALRIDFSARERDANGRLLPDGEGSE